RAGWAGVTLAELGRFSTAGLGALVAGAVALLAAWNAMPRPGGARALARAVAPPGRWAPRGELLALLGLLALAGALFGQPGEDVLGARDPGIYFATGAAIARQGGVLQDDPELRAMAAVLGDASLHYRLFQTVTG